ncbi:MAG: universal stress protein [Pelagimonas sp.]|uniref:universal stress protein n=1 Tax=Pelagimonas sp. TaxID=2073170 RepID=UPI003D6A861A
MFEKILLAVDLNQSKGKRRTADAAIQLAQANGAELHVLTVLPDTGLPVVSMSLPKDHTDQIKTEAAQALAVWGKDVIPSDVNAVFHVGQGTIYDQIIKFSDALGIGAIVIGAHRPELKDYLVGPNSARVVRHATQSVFVIR